MTSLEEDLLEINKTSFVTCLGVLNYRDKNYSQNFENMEDDLHER